MNHINNLDNYSNLNVNEDLVRDSRNQPIRKERTLEVNSVGGHKILGIYLNNGLMVKNGDQLGKSSEFMGWVDYVDEIAGQDGPNRIGLKSIKARPSKGDVRVMESVGKMVINLSNEGIRPLIDKRSERHEGKSGGIQVGTWKRGCEICVGDFNEIIDELEKVVGSQKPWFLLENFEVASDDCVLQDIRYSDEIRRAVFDIFPVKALGPDSILALFFKKFWNMVGLEVTKAYLGVLNEGRRLDVVKKTLIILILKTKKPERITNYCPVRFCNVLYKIVAKALANRLLGVLGEVISNTQSAFILGRLISYNAIIGFECMHALRTRKTGKVT
ncbi:hypothetical protein Ddye_032366 [Dipteronia dyeriana]|uniref:Reverse transcriptase domain-containing protein n=1 Tax=Dipteronia dyeriana TaxID=168575 RepID=A0AAD9WN60_9ROSI|nr:hypothetical protein Ddye_032366 [Dipteronia dyeriana]